MPKHKTTIEKYCPPASLPPIQQISDPNRLIRLKEVLQIIPCKKSTWWLWVKQSKAPQPIRLGRCTCWLYSDVVAMIQTAGV